MFNKKKHDYKAKLEHKLYLARENPEPIFDISDCGLRDVPSGVFSLCRVFLKESLLLNNNKLSSLDNGGSLGDLRSIKVLNIQHNVFISLPKDIALLIGLKELYVNNNKLKHLPSTIASLVNLRVLDVSFNNLKDLPPEMGNLIQLEYLNISENSNLHRLPASLCRASNLIHLKLDVENFIYPPLEVVANGVECILKFLSEDCGIEYVAPTKSPEASQSNLSFSAFNVDPNSRLQAKIWEHEALKEKKQKERLKLEKDFEEFHQKELELQAAHKVSRLKFLLDITQQQSKLEYEIMKIQNMKEAERMKLINKLREEEERTDLAIIQLLNINKQSFSHYNELEQLEDEKILAAAARHNETLRKNDILNAMQSLLEKETENFKQYDQNREETARSVLVQEMLTNDHLAQVLKNQESHQAELVSKLQKDMELQRFAVGALLERSDARSWSIIQQVLLVETQLAKLTAIEMDRHKLELDEQVNDLAEKRANLSALLVDLLAQQEIRKTELISTLNNMEELGNTQEDFWLRQYQQLLDRRPEFTDNVQKNIDPWFAQELLLAGVIHYLPFLASWIQTKGAKEELTDEHLVSVGVKNREDRSLIVEAYSRYLSAKEKVREVPTAPATDIPAIVMPSAPVESPTGSEFSSECVICMNLKCEIVFIPCGHLCCCPDCSFPLEDCPLCRGHIERKIKVIMP